MLSLTLLSGCTHAPLSPTPPNISLPYAREHALQQDKKALRQRVSKDQPLIALVLGSGGARGYAHIGVIRMLEAYGIRPHFIVGTSAGSIVATL